MVGFNEDDRFIPAPAGNTRGRGLARAPRPVHPRTCGEHPEEGTTLRYKSGSSPHLRGTRQRKTPHRRKTRFIPAPAGNTAQSRLTFPILTVHPRTCGEHLQASGFTTSWNGSSPHLRGTHSRSDLFHDVPRFIPAPAGNTGSVCSEANPCSVHPRTCGEHSNTNLFIRNSAGSSPHLRGTPDDLHHQVVSSRFIPAPAGNTCPRPSGAAPRPVHPRTCGEHSMPAAVREFLIGSSPHLRGTLLVHPDDRLEPRFIPAPAGNTTWRFSGEARPSVHPRTCGEHMNKTMPVSSAPGSSPHLRGTHSPGDAHRGRSRFIPAPAGNTFSSTGRDRPRTVHPRTCGEHTPAPISPPAHVGSSPHLRGTRRCCHYQRPRSRFIPAPAGNTVVSTATFDGGSVHPRTCGEHGISVSLRPAGCGSSPHLRGTRVLGGLGRLGRRFIPAPAGNTVIKRFFVFNDPVHPRTCGEHDKSQLSDKMNAGSSPHLRGTHYL